MGTYQWASSSLKFPVCEKSSHDHGNEAMIDQFSQGRQADPVGFLVWGFHKGWFITETEQIPLKSG